MCSSQVQIPIKKSNTTLKKIPKYKLYSIVTKILIGTRPYYATAYYKINIVSRRTS